MDAEVFWTEDAFPHVIKAYARPVHDPGLGTVVRLGRMASDRTLLKTNRGVQHLLIHARRRALQIAIRGQDIRAEPFVLEIITSDFPNVLKGQSLVRTFAELYRARSLNGLSGTWTVEALRHKEALFALDMHRAGASHREIAVAIVGKEAVAKGFNAPDKRLRNLVRQRLRAAQSRVAGGYRDLLLRASPP